MSVAAAGGPPEGAGDIAATGGPPEGAGVIAAAGTLPWRHREERLEVAVVHRPRYDDWSWPKGKLEDGERWPIAAARETAEEIGLRVRLGRPLPDSEYVPESGGAPVLKPVVKQVRYWSAGVVDGKGRLEHEIDEVRWLAAEDAHALLSYARDREQLDHLEQAHAEHRLCTRPFVIVRHAKALARKDWTKKDDWLRPLDDRGRRQAKDLPDLLSAYGVTALLSSNATRCTQTLAPYAKRARLEMRTTRHLSEEGFAKHPRRAVDALMTQFAVSAGSAVCSHGPLLPDLLETLVDCADEAAAAALAEAAETNLHKGEALFAHVVDAAEGPLIVAVERHRPLR